MVYGILLQQNQSRNRTANTRLQRDAAKRRAPEACRSAKEDWSDVVMRMLKLLILAVCIGCMLLLAWLVYPDRIERVIAELNDESGAPTRGDVAIFVESISAGFTIGFFILKALFQRLSSQQAIHMIESDKSEIKIVFVFITGVSFYMASLSLFEESVLQGSIHLVIAIACMLYLPIKYIISIKKKRGMIQV